MNELILEGLKIAVLLCVLAFFTAVAIKVLMNFFLPANTEHEKKVKELLGN